MWAARNRITNGPNDAVRAALVLTVVSSLYGIQRADRCTGESALQKRVDPLLELLDRGLALDLLTIDEEGWRRIHFENLAGVFLVGFDLVEQRLILQSGLDLFLAESGLLVD